MKDTGIIMEPGEGMCPWCNKKFRYSIRQTPPKVYWMLKQEDLDVVKEKLIKEISEIKFKDQETKQGVIDWLNREETLIGPEEAPIIVEQMRNDEKEKIEKEKESKQ